ncbi:hypothetical protein [Lentibacillus songyuanensis]|uniref:hypothetical protein n=1 Tax=Lentibacillus songyuanensis TaxID=3136161 RepID=UPI0031BA00BB
MPPGLSSQVLDFDQQKRIPIEGYPMFADECTLWQLSDRTGEFFCRTVHRPAVEGRTKINSSPAFDAFSRQ